MKRLIPFAAALLLTGCAWTEDTVAVQRQSVSVAQVQGAAEVGVTVTSADARQEREISHKKNGYGMRGANIVPANDVVAEVRNGVQEILNGKGFRAGRDANVRVEVSRFYSTFDMGFWSATANAQVTASVQVTSADGRSLYARVYSATFPYEGVQVMSGENAASGLRSALDALLRQVADDAQLNQALLQARPAPIVTPEPIEPPRRTRGRVGA